MKKSLLVALCLGLAAITAAAQRTYSQVDPIQPVPTCANRQADGMAETGNLCFYPFRPQHLQ